MSSVSNAVLIIDDDVELCSMLRDYLAPNGFRVDVLHHGQESTAAIRNEKYAMVILDVMLPDMDGFEVLRLLRSWSNIGVLLLSARGSDADRIVGLETGADDYLAKPFNPRELLARIGAILRRGRAPDPVVPESPRMLEVDEFVMDPKSRTVLYQDQPLELTALEYSLMEAFLEAPGEILSREDLVERVFCREFHPLDRSLDMNMSRLRKKLPAGDRIKTIRSAGYLFTAA